MKYWERKGCEFILYKTHNSPKLNTLEEFETHKNEILNDQITYNDHILYDVTTK